MNGARDPANDPLTERLRALGPPLEGSPEFQARLESELMAALGGPVGPPPTPPGGSPTDGRAFPRFGRWTVGLAGVFLGALMGAWAHSAFAPARVVVRREVVASPPLVRVETRVVERPVASSTPAPAPRPPVPRDAEASAHVPLLDRGPREDRDRELFRRLSGAFGNGRFDEALSLLERHAREFPESHYRTERDALRVRTLAHLGRVEEARAGLARFERGHPQSAQIEVLRREVGGAP